MHVEGYMKLGRLSYESHVARHLNPYKLNTWRFQAWQSGWLMAKLRAASPDARLLQ